MNTTIKSDYLRGDRSVDLRSHFAEQEKLEKSGLANIEILDSQKEMGKDEFLKLLVAQLSHQDPTAPMKDQEFIAQMAQFSSLEQMHNIAGNLGSMADRQAMTLVGKFVSGPDSMNGNNYGGTVEALFFDESGAAMLKVGDRAIRVSDVKMISEPEVIERHAAPLLQEKSAPAANPVEAQGVSEPAILKKEAIEPVVPEKEKILQEAPVSLLEKRMGATAYENGLMAEEREISFFRV